MSKVEQLINKFCPDGVEYRRLENCCEILDNKRKPVTKSAREAGKYPYYGANGIQDYVSNYIFDGTFILVGEDGSVVTEMGTPIVTWATGKIWVNNHAHIISEINGVLLRYLFHYLQTVPVKHLIHGNIPKLTGGDFRALKIAVPPLPIQEEIVRILDKFTELTAELTAELSARKQQYEYYKDKLLTFEYDSVGWCELNDVIISLNTGLNPRKFFRLNTEDAINYYVTIREIHGGRIVPTDKTDRINDEALALCNNRSNLEIGDVLFSGTGTIGETAVIVEYPQNWNIKEGVYAIKPNKKRILPKFLRYLLTATYIKTAYMKKVAGGTVKSIPMGELRKLEIPIPYPEDKEKSLAEQQRIVDILDRFDRLCNDISEGLPAEIEARQKQYEYYRDKLLTFKKKEAAENE